MELTLFGSPVNSVFELMGETENDISFSVGYSLANSPSLLYLFLQRLGISSTFDNNTTKIQLQEYEQGKGYTDFEIIQGLDFHIIIEAKRGWVFPEIEQLCKYSERSLFTNSQTREKLLVVLNESTSEYAQSNFQHESVNDFPILVMSWQDVLELSKIASTNSSQRERWILRDLISYLNKISTMRKSDSNWTYVVSLGSTRPEGWSISFQEIVEKRNLYFHPVGGNKGGWPSEPPNYIAFRYKGKLQSIHHIESFTVFSNPSDHFDEIPSGDWGPHFLYTLGPAIVPSRTIPTGPKIQRSMRVWACLDLLLTSSTIQEARDLSKLRIN